MKSPKPTHAKCGDLVNDISRGKIKIPQFQREFVVTHGNRVIGFISSYADAVKAGYTECRLEPFLVKLVDKTRFLPPLMRNPIGLKRAGPDEKCMTYSIGIIGTGTAATVTNWSQKLNFTFRERLGSCG